MTKIITIAQQEGGATKTSMNLAGALIEAGYIERVADNNEQRSVAKWAKRNNKFQNVVISIFDKQPHKDILTIVNGIDFLTINAPPELMTPGLKAALLLDLIIIPCPPSPLDLEAAEETVVRGGTSIWKQLPETLKRSYRSMESMNEQKT